MRAMQEVIGGGYEGLEECAILTKGRSDEEKSLSLEGEMASMGRTLRVINQMVSDGIIDRYAIGGAVAALNYIEPAATEDIDILISLEVQSSGLITLGALVEYLAAKGYTEWKKEGLMIEGWPVQFIPASSPLDFEALGHAETVEDTFGMDEIVSTRVLSAEHVVATALNVGRPKDYTRIIAFLDEQAVDLARLKATLERHGLDAKWVMFCEKIGLSNPFASRSPDL
jgi:hypothetical protein